MNINNLLDLKITDFINLLSDYDVINIRGINYSIENLEIRYTSIEDLNIIIFKFNTNLFIYGFTSIENLIKPTINLIQDYNFETNEFIIIDRQIVPKSLTIDTEDKGYCFEILNHNYLKDVLELNFITTNIDKGCNIKFEECKPLNYLFSIIYKFLEEIQYNEAFYLKDHSQLDKVSLLLFNLLKERDSIYCKYGFEYTKTGWYTLNKIKNNILKLKLFILSNYPDFKLDKKYMDLLDVYFNQNGLIDLSPIEMVCKNFRNYFNVNKPCKFIRQCSNRFDFDCYIKPEDLILFQTDINYKKFVFWIINRSLQNLNLKFLNGTLVFINSNNKFKNNLDNLKKMLIFLDVIGYKKLKNIIINELSNKNIIV
jgi:hypothetical protein